MQWLNAVDLIPLPKTPEELVQEKLNRINWISVEVARAVADGAREAKCKMKRKQFE